MSPISPQMSKPTRQPCLIVGCGGHGRVVLDILAHSDRYEPIGFVDSNPRVKDRRIDGVPVLGRPDDMTALREKLCVSNVIIAIGHNGVRRAFADRFEQLDFTLINAVHPSANLARNVTLGRNIVIAAGALVCAHCQIGDSAILNTGCIVDHESTIGTATHVCPGAKIAGRVAVESGAFVGIGATIIQGVRVGCESTIGAGAVVIHDVAPMSTVVGVPAREIKGVDHASAPAAWLASEFLHHDATEPAFSGKS